MNNIINSIKASRPFLWVNTAFPFAAGWLFVNQQYTWLLVIGFLFFLFPYNLAMYGINDIFDYESDIKNPRKASVEGAQLQKNELRKLWRFVTLFCIPFIVVLSIYSSSISFAVLVFSLFMVIAYSATPFRFKEIPFLDSITSSCHFTTPLLFGITFAGGTIVSFLPAITSLFCWGIASHSFGAVQDVNYDREGGIASIATVLGARFTIWFSTTLYVVAALVTLISYRTFSGYVSTVYLFLFAANTLRFCNVSDQLAETTHKGWRMFMALCMGLGCFITLFYLYRYDVLGIQKFTLLGPLIISSITFCLFYVFLRTKRT